jgi:hypothetical protein
LHFRNHTRMNRRVAGMLWVLVLSAMGWASTSALGAENIGPKVPSESAKSAPAKQWVWLTKQNCWGYGHQRADGLWVIDPGTKRAPAASVQPAAPAGDPYGFINWLNATRAAVGLSAVGYDPNLSAWANSNNAQQQSLGLGHHVMGPARRQNAAMGSATSIGAQWMASPAHRAALLDPSIRLIGIAGLGAFWTFNAY